MVPNPEEPLKKQFVIAVFLLIAAGLAFRAFDLAHPAPLWSDETFTGAIASQPTFGDVLRLAHFDAPASVLYYLFMHVWQMIFGLSDIALRFPSLCFSIGTPLVICLSEVPGVSRGHRLCWAAMMSLWLPGIGFAQDARCYAALLFFAVMQTISFTKLLECATLPRALLWVGLADVTMLGHYDAAFLAVTQGVILLALKRQSAIKLWPALFLTLPVWLDYIWQFPVIEQYAQSGVAWYHVLNKYDLIAAVSYPFSGLSGSSVLIWLLLCPVLFLTIFVVRGRRRDDEKDLALPAPVWSAIASLAGYLIVLIIGFIRPTLTWRYMAPFEPGLLLGFVFIITQVYQNVRQPALVIFLAISLVSDLTAYQFGLPFGDSAPTALNIETASQFLIRKKVKTIVFTWDNSAAPLEGPELLSDVGGFFFFRAHVPVTVTTVQTTKSSDPDALLLRTAEPTGAAILWLYDVGVIGTSAKDHPPDIDKVDARYLCKHFGEIRFGSVACYRDGGDL